MALVDTFLTESDETAIIQAISTAEKLTSGEIRVHIEAGGDYENIVERAAEVFRLLKMDRTRLRNGVLIYIDMSHHRFAIYGDQGINEAVPDDFWSVVRDHIESHFKTGHFKDGLIAGITEAGQALKTYFPADDGDNPDELPNEISKGQ